ncbi:DNA-binding protein RFX7 [Frankliniella fusca]|uniref:DNA-binding protein RFX7 n=1 Tax=Frankliniella fusca TaxID=407009 RepID=A0AAE1HZT4_9NEOP|nr:DNA-binding protein RFX7 [Frankliniella fusca]
METLDRKLSSLGGMLASSDYPAAPNIKCEMDNSSISRDRQLLNLRDLEESDRTTMIQDTVEKAVSIESKHTIECLLAQIRQLSPIEKLLLYLKLPNGKSSVDPLRQNLNPLGSRLEIHHTITWIKTHLQEDPEVSLPKQDVYEQYLEFCQGNSVKPLSTADFGKVMKQVYPNVRPRRLGTRGHSRYCYAGLRKRVHLAPPVLPDLGPSEKVALEDSTGGKAGSPERTLLVAVSVLIREWAGKTLGLRFSSLQDLACHLVQSMSVNVQTTAALTVLSSLNSPAPRSAGPSRPTSSAASLGSEERPPSSCSVGLSRPASETPRSSIERDHKRKIQEDVERLRSKNCESKMRGKRTKHRSSSSPQETNSTGGRRPVANKLVAPTTNSNCDSSMISQSHTTVPYMSTKNGQADVQNNNILLSNGSVLDSHGLPVNPTFSETVVPDVANASSTGNAHVGANNYASTQRPEVGPDGKLPIPRLPKPTCKQTVPHYISMPFTSPCLSRNQQSLQQQSPLTVSKQKYKPIKPKPNTEDSSVSKIDCNATKQLTISDKNGVLKAASSQKSGNDAIIGCLEKDALDDYLHGGSNSQEQEEELMQYFPQQAQQNQSSSMQVDPSNSMDKISQLRRLLEKNMSQDMAGKGPQYPNGLSAAASLSLLSQRNQQKQSLILPALLTCQQNNARRVSFEVPGDTDSAANSVPPSPNTKQRFSFTPISPRPYSPTKSSSANASPFVSPRNTPIPRRMSTQPSTSFMQAASSSSSSMYPGKTKGNIPRTMVRSMSVNSEACSLSPFHNVNQRSFVASNSVDNNQMSMDVKPDINSLQEMTNTVSMQGSAFSSTWNPSQNLVPALPPLQLPRSQYQVSMSAPQSPVVHSSKSIKKSTFNFRKETRAHSFDMDSSNLLMSAVDFKNQTELPQFQSNLLMQNTPDRYSQEVSEIFPEDDIMMQHLSSMPCMSSFRSQSVPLRRMVNSVAVSPMPATALPSPHYGPPAPPSQQGYFNFNQFTPGSSVAPTPVPSEIADFGVDSDGMHSSTGLQDLELIREDLGDASQEAGMTTENFNPDILHEMLNMFEDGKNDAQQTPQEFPQTPEQYKPDPETTLRGDPLFSSFRLQAVGSDGSCPEEQLTLSVTQPSVTNSSDPILTELNSMAEVTSAQQGMDSLLEGAPSSFITEDLECEISQLTREVGNSSN